MKKVKKWQYSVIGALLLMAILMPGRVDADDVDGVPTSFTCDLWPEGQKMFYSDPYWRGGDCASTVDLGDGRILWLFADSYVGIKPPYFRDYCCVDMIRNCMGIQRGYDPLTAEFTVYWRGTDVDPEPYFPSDDSSCFWPGNGVRIDDMLFVFLMQVCSSDSGLGFRTCGQAAFLIGNLEAEPLDWSISQLVLPDNPFGILLGAAILVEPPYLYIFSIREPGDHSIYLSRWHTDSVLAGRHEAIEWWTDDTTAWVPNSELISEPAELFPSGATEFSVVYDERIGQYLAIQIVGFGAGDVMMRTALSLTGPWSDRKLLFQPPEKAKPNIMIYAAKTHREIVGADLILTYMTNGPTQMIIEDSTIYYPRLLKLNWKR
jgi:hypothetical protein